MGTFAALLPLAAAALQTSAANGPVWRWDREWAGCGLIQYADEQTVLEIERTPGAAGTGFEIRPAKPITAAQKTWQGGTMTFRPAGAVASENTVVNSYDGRREIRALSDDPDFMNKFANSTEVEFTHEKIGQTKLPVLSAKAAADALRACEDSKMHDWGIDSAAWRALPVKPKPLTPPANWFSYLDYPDREKIYKNDITVVARLDLGPDGSVQSCTAVNDPPKEFSTAACDGLRRRARLQPARDTTGKAVPAPYVVVVIFGAFPL